MIFLPIVALGALALFALVQLLVSLGPYARVLRQPTRKIASLAGAGPAEVAGTLRATEEPLTAMNGTPAVALKTTISYAYRKGSKTYRGFTTKTARAVATELSDETGTCALELGAVLLLGPTWFAQMGAKRFAEDHAAVHAEAGIPDNAVTIYVEQVYVPDGATGTASGEIEPDAERADPGDGYRGPSRGRVRLASAIDRPLILAAYGEPEVRRRLLRPARLLAAIALGAAAAAGSLLFVAHAIHG